MADTDKETQAPTAPPAGETQTPAPAASPAPAAASTEKTEDTAATQAKGTETETKQPDKSFPITAEEISLIETESANGFFPECKKAIDAYKAGADDKAKTDAAKSFLTNWAKEKTVHILKTNESLKDVNELIKDKLSQAKELTLEDYVKMVEENPEAKTALLKVMENGAQGGETPEGQTPANVPATDSSKTPQGGETPEGQTTTDAPAADSSKTPQEGEEDPWISKALSRLRSKKLY